MIDCMHWCRQHSDNIWSEDEVLKLAASVESNTIHPVGKAIVEAARAVKCPNIKVLFRFTVNSLLWYIIMQRTATELSILQPFTLVFYQQWIFLLFLSFQAVHQLAMRVMFFSFFGNSQCSLHWPGQWWCPFPFIHWLWFSCKRVFL